MQKINGVQRVTLIIVLIVIVLIAALVLPAVFHSVHIRRQPIQNMQAEVVGKRTIKCYSSGGKERAIPYCIVAFKLPNGSEKEFGIKFELFNELQESDTGTLSFQEHKNVTKWKEEDRWAHRRFISFEKDE